MIAIDTNILIYAHRSGAEQHKAARETVERAAATAAWGFSFVVVSEFWSQVTHPRYPGAPSSARKARGFMGALIEAGASIFVPGKGFAERLMLEATNHGVQGVRIFDLQIALAARDNGAHEIWTCDRKFVRIRGLKVVNPI